MSNWDFRTFSIRVVYSAFGKYVFYIDKNLQAVHIDALVLMSRDFLVQENNYIMKYVNFKFDNYLLLIFNIYFVLNILNYRIYYVLLLFII